MKHLAQYLLSLSLFLFCSAACADAEKLKSPDEQLAAKVAEISRMIDEQNGQKNISVAGKNNRTYITHSTKNREHALYYKMVSKKIEDYGTDHFPSKDGKKLYGEAYVSVAITESGNIDEQGSGIQIERSSGNKNLDDAALSIARHSAPFSRFSKARTSNKQAEIRVLIFHFNFNKRETEAPTDNKSTASK
ncbi:energy transducer TonB [Undibacterium sp. Ji83W]|uniref:energy transducer TonB n=1 Tax=Undibacterium sp. Ji83W TaxID=3413043 RepID=UPI003BEFBBAD